MRQELIRLDAVPLLIKLEVEEVLKRFSSLRKPICAGICPKSSTEASLLAFSNSFIRASCASPVAATGCQ
jgi:hypothetical protein